MKTDPGGMPGFALKAGQFVSWQVSNLRREESLRGKHMVIDMKRRIELWLAACEFHVQGSLL